MAPEALSGHVGTMSELIDRLRSALSERYSIEKEIGAGGMATVYLAEDVRHHRKVAVKVLRSELAATMGPDRFLREIEIAAQLQHPHVLPLYDSGEAEGFLYYVMPYVEGESLRDKVDREGELPVGEAVRILRDVVDALAYAHDQGVVHRDIKPDNVLISGRHAMVTDFGIAKAVSEATGRYQLTTVGVALGTPSYMAPEQAAAEPHIDHRADIYAVGAMAYELLTGRPPFTGHTQAAILAAHVTEEPKPITEHRAAVPTVLADVIMRCLEKKAADRYQTAEALLPALEGLATPSGGMTPIETRPVEAAVRLRGSRNWTVVTALVAAVAIVGVGVMLLFRGGETAELIEDRVLIGVFQNETGDASLDPIGKIAADWLSRGLHETGLVDVVDERNVEEGAGGESGSAGAARLRAMAQQVGAGLIVTGSYYATGDSLQLQAQLIDAEDGSIVRAIGPMNALLSAPQEAIGELRDRMMGAFANILDPRFGAIAPGINPPSYQAYQEFVAGDEAFNQRRFSESAERLMAAYRMDTTFVIAAVRAAVAHSNDQRCDAVDSLAIVLYAKRQIMAPYDRYYLDRIVARCHGDYQEHLHAAEEMMRVAPKSPYAQYLAGRSALWVNRVQYGLEIMEAFDPSQSELRSSYHQVLRDISTAYHMLGDFEGERTTLEGWDGWEESFRGQEANVRVLAGLGRHEEAWAAAEQGAALSVSGRPFWSSDIVCFAAAEIRAHGGADEALVSAEACLTAIERRGSAGADSLAWAARRADALYRLGRTEEAEGAYQGILELQPDFLIAMGRIGVIAAMSGREEEAATWDGRLADYVQEYGAQGLRTLWRAKLTAALGDVDRGVELVRLAANEGLNFWSSTHSDPFHVDIDLEPLFGNPSYQELMAPKR